MNHRKLVRENNLSQIENKARTWQSICLFFLPIMRVLTLIPHVTSHFVIEWAPDSLEMEHVKVCVLLKFMQQVNRQLVLAMCKSAQISKVTAFLRAFRAKLGLVLLRVIE